MIKAPHMSDDLLRRTRRETKTGCMLWTGARDEKGYGLVRFEGKTQRAHRAVIKALGVMIEGAVVRHACDTPRCINPHHLRVGTQRDNVADCIAKGRMPRGERKIGAKLAEADVVAIRGSQMSLRRIARQFMVSIATIRGIRGGVSWRHVQ